MQDVARVAAVIGPTALAGTWSDGTASTVDLAGWIARGSERIAPLRDPAVVARADLGLSGGSVTWDGDEGDLATDSEHLRMIADHQAPFAAAEVAAWQAEMGASNAEAADLVGVVASTWASYKADANIPATVARLCRAMRADPVTLSAHLQPRMAGRPSVGTVESVCARMGNVCAAPPLASLRERFRTTCRRFRSTISIAPERWNGPCHRRLRATPDASAGGLRRRRCGCRGPGRCDRRRR